MQHSSPLESSTAAHYQLDMTALLGIDLPPECVPGIEASADLLRHHARKVEAFVYPPNANKDGEPES